MLKENQLVNAKRYLGSKILFVSNDLQNIESLGKIIRDVGYLFVSTQSRMLSIEQIEQGMFDLIIWDIDMLEEDNFELCKNLNSEKSIKKIPSILLTDDDKNELLESAIEAGCVDYIRKPVVFFDLLLRIQLHLHAKHLEDEFKHELQFRKQIEGSLKNVTKALEFSNNQLQKRNDELINEQYIAKKIFDNIVHKGVLEESYINYIASPLSVFNGDLLLAEKISSGNLYIMLGDFTGHGLPAAIGILPTADIFYSMAHRNASLSDIIVAINLRLKQFLPIGFFCAAGFLEINYQKKKYSVWGGGISDILHTNQHGELKNRIQAQHVPIGILAAEAFSGRMEEWSFSNNDKLYLYSDGIIEMKNQQKDEFCVEGIIQSLKVHKGKEGALDFIVQEAMEFSKNPKVYDDITLIEIFL